MDTTDRCNTVGFSVMFGSEVGVWVGWVVRGCPRCVRRSCERGGRPENQSATSPGCSRSLPAPSTEYSRPPAGSLHLGEVGQGGHSLWPSGRRSPENLRPESRCALSLPAWAGVPRDRKPGSYNRNGGRGSYRAMRRPTSGPGTESSASEKMPARKKRSLARCGSKEAQGGLVAAANLRLAEKTLS